MCRRRQWQPTPVLLPGKSYGRRSLIGCSPWGCKESDTTERLHLLTYLNHVQLFVTLWTVAHQALLSMGFSRQEYWSRWPCPSPGDLPDPEIKLGCPALHSDSLPLRHLGRPYFQIKSHSEVLEVKKSNRNLWGERSQPSVVVVRLLSHVRLFLTPLTAAHQASLPFTISQSLLKLMSIESVMPSNHLILCLSLLFLPPIFPSIRIFSNESALYIRWPKYWSFSFSISPSNECSCLENPINSMKRLWCF